MYGFGFTSEDVANRAPTTKLHAVGAGLVGVVCVTAATYFAGKAVTGGRPQLMPEGIAGQRASVKDIGDQAVQNIGILRWLPMAGVVAALIGTWFSMWFSMTGSQADANGVDAEGPSAAHTDSDGRLPP